MKVCNMQDFMDGCKQLIVVNSTASWYNHFSVTITTKNGKKNVKSLTFPPYLPATVLEICNCWLVTCHTFKTTKSTQPQSNPQHSPDAFVSEWHHYECNAHTNYEHQASGIPSHTSYLSFSGMQEVLRSLSYYVEFSFRSHNWPQGYNRMTSQQGHPPAGELRQREEEEEVGVKAGMWRRKKEMSTCCIINSLVFLKPLSCCHIPPSLFLFIPPNWARSASLQTFRSGQGERAKRRSRVSGTYSFTKKCEWTTLSFKWHQSVYCPLDYIIRTDLY